MKKRLEISDAHMQRGLTDHPARPPKTDECPHYVGAFRRCQWCGAPGGKLQRAALLAELDKEAVFGWIPDKPDGEEGQEFNWIAYARGMLAERPTQEAALDVLAERIWVRDLYNTQYGTSTQGVTSGRWSSGPAADAAKQEGVSPKKRKPYSKPRAFKVGDKVRPVGRSLTVGEITKIYESGHRPIRVAWEMGIPGKSGYAANELALVEEPRLFKVGDKVRKHAAIGEIVEIRERVMRPLLVRWRPGKPPHPYNGDELTLVEACAFKDTCPKEVFKVGDRVSWGTSRNYAGTVVRVLEHCMHVEHWLHPGRYAGKVTRVFSKVRAHTNEPVISDLSHWEPEVGDTVRHPDDESTTGKITGFGVGCIVKVQWSGLGGLCEYGHFNSLVPVSQPKEEPKTEERAAVGDYVRIAPSPDVDAILHGKVGVVVEDRDSVWRLLVGSTYVYLKGHTFERIEVKAKVDQTEPQADETPLRKPKFEVGDVVFNLGDTDWSVGVVDEDGWVQLSPTQRVKGGLAFRYATYTEILEEMLRRGLVHYDKRARIWWSGQAVNDEAPEDSYAAGWSLDLDCLQGVLLARAAPDCPPEAKPLLQGLLDNKG